jgi:hypothetical protein
VTADADVYDLFAVLAGADKKIAGAAAVPRMG